MITYERAITLPLEKLIEYNRALSEICARYESDMKPYYNTNMVEYATKWKELNAKLGVANAYRNTIFSALEYKVYNSLDEFDEASDNKKKPIRKKPSVESRNTTRGNKK